MSNIAKQSSGSRRRANASPGKSRVPSLRFHKASGQMYVVLSGRAIYCGKPDDPATQQRYHQAVAEWLAAGRQLPAEPATITIKEVLGPKAQKVLTPFLLRNPDAFCFSPAEAMEEWRRQVFKNRATPLSQGNGPGTNRKESPKWTPGEHYKTDTYRCAIARGCDRAFPPPEPLAKREDENRKCRKRALLAAARHGTVRLPALAAPRKHGQANKYFVYDLLGAWPGYLDEGVDLPPLLAEHGDPP